MLKKYVNENHKQYGVAEKKVNEKGVSTVKSSNGDKVYFEFLKNVKSKSFDDFEDYSTVFMTF